MSRQDSNKRRTVDRVEQAGQDYRRYVDVALVVIGGATELYAAVSPLVAEWKRRERRRYARLVSPGLRTPKVTVMAEEVGDDGAVDRRSARAAGARVECAPARGTDAAVYRTRADQQR